MGAGYDIGVSGPSTSASATSSTGPVSLSFGGSTDWTLILSILGAGILVMLFLLKRRK
ncbi:MAG: hypothetical protein KGL39_26035 [Patescibacteria group bacterium]|nr:hypothetical protein [Patescibacteria group bacterium]